MRFYAVGEYADDVYEDDANKKGYVVSFGRAHYHAVLFGMPGCVYGVTRKLNGGCCQFCDLYQRTWNLGHVFVGQLSRDSAQYVAGYCTKKMTGRDDKRLYGRYPEFPARSNDPPIGADALWDVASMMIKYGLDEKAGDVPPFLEHGGKRWPLDRTMRERLRVMIGREKGASDASSDKIYQEMQPVREAAFASNARLASVVSALDDGRFANLESKLKIFRKRRNLR